MKTRWTIVGSLLLAFGLGAAAQDVYEDDIYFNPKKEKKEQATKKAKSNYIENFSDIDVDAYNMQGGFMMMPSDTIGARTENGEDFVYTQQIQKYYNPTIVIDNADLLADVLNNSYGNVDVVFNTNGLITFAPYSYSSWNWPYSYGWGYGWPYRYGWGSPYWGGWGWNVGFYDPWYAWGPSWGWGSSWGWGPGWGWGPSWGAGWGRPGYAYDYTPHGNRRVGAGGNWANSTRPGGNYAGNYDHRGSYRAPSISNSYNAAGGNRRVYNSGNGTNGTLTTNRRVNGSNSGYTINSNGHRVSGAGTNGTTTNRTYNSNRSYNSNSNRTYNSTTNSNRTYNSNRSYNSNSNRSYNSNSNRSYNSGGSYRSSGGGGSYRGGGGGGGRGRHR